MAGVCVTGGTCMAGGHVWWWGACMAGGCMAVGHVEGLHGRGMHGKEGMHAGEMATEVSGAHPTGMHSC